MDFYLLLVYEDFVIRRGTRSIGVTLCQPSGPSNAFFSRSVVISPIQVFSWRFHASLILHSSNFLQVISDPIFYKRMHLTKLFNAVTTFSKCLCCGLSEVPTVKEFAVILDVNLEYFCTIKDFSLTSSSFLGKAGGLFLQRMDC